MTAAPVAHPTPGDLLIRMLDAVLLDWEGVLADTTDARQEALVQALAAEGVRQDETAGDAAADALALLRHSDPTLAGLVASRATRAFAERFGRGFVMLPGAREFVERVQLAAPLAIVTSATRAETEFMLKLAGLDAAVTTIVSADDHLDPPPSAATFVQAIAQLSRRRSLNAARAVAMAQTSSALRAARAAGVRTVAIGAPAHVAVDADGAADSIDGLRPPELARLAGIAAAEHGA